VGSKVRSPLPFIAPVSLTAEPDHFTFISGQKFGGYNAGKEPGSDAGEETSMKRFLLISTAALLISGAPAAFAQNGANPSGPRPSGTGATKATTGMAKAHAKGGQAGNRVNSMAGSNAGAGNSQNSDEGRTSGGGGGGGSGM
jgi:hypothetical protein